MRFNILITLLACAFVFPAGQASADSLEIREWLVPYKNTRPRDPFVDARGRVWFVGQKGNYIGNMSPDDGLFNRYDLPSGAGPHNLLVDDSRNIWYAGNRGRHIGVLSPSTGQVEQIAMPDRKAKDPHTLAFDPDGNIWFTVQNGNFIGHLTTADRNVSLIPVETRKARPYGIIVASNGTPWAVAFGTNKLLQVDPDLQSIREIELPDPDSRPRRLVETSTGEIWYTDYALGRLGRYSPETGEIAEWSMPGGADSQPYGMAVDKHDRIWIVECGVEPNRFVGFDTQTGAFLSQTDIPSGAGSVRHMFYHEPAGEVWFGTDTNYVGRARVH